LLMCLQCLLDALLAWRGPVHQAAA
jgi:hypothetical protein